MKHEALWALTRIDGDNAEPAQLHERTHNVALSIDHIVIAVRDLARASADYEAAGFTVTPGGEHTGGATHNALVTFGDGAYFELIAFKEPDRPQEHRWWAKLAKGEGLVDFALFAADLDAVATRLRGAGLAIEGPLDGGRLRPDGQRIAWRTLLPTPTASPLPFLIDDVTPRELRVPGGGATRHRLGVPGFAGVVVAVADLDGSAPAFSALLGTGAAVAQPAAEGAGRGQRFALSGEQWIGLVEPDGADGPLTRHLAARGDGPYEIVLAAAGDDVEPGSLLPLDQAHGARIRIGG